MIPCGAGVVVYDPSQDQWMALFLSHFRRKGVREGEAPFTTTHASMTERELPVPTALGFAGSEVFIPR